MPPTERRLQLGLAKHHPSLAGAVVLDWGSWLALSTISLRVDAVPSASGECDVHPELKAGVGNSWSGQRAANPLSLGIATGRKGCVAMVSASMKSLNLGLCDRSSDPFAS